MLVGYRGIVHEGRIRLCDPVELPEGVEVLIVAAGDDQRRASFEAIRTAWATSEPALDENQPLDDEALVALVHQVRDESQ
jgi:hypothetical protein